MDIGQTIRDARQVRGLTRERLAELAGVSGSTLSRVELQRGVGMHGQSLVSIATALHAVLVLSVEELGAFSAAADMKPEALAAQMQRSRADRSRQDHPRRDLYDLADRLADLVGLSEACLTIERLADMAAAVAPAPLSPQQAADILVHRSETEIPAEGDEPPRRVTILSPHRRAEPKPPERRQKGAN